MDSTRKNTWKLYQKTHTTITYRYYQKSLWILLDKYIDTIKKTHRILLENKAIQLEKQMNIIRITYGYYQKSLWLLLEKYMDTTRKKWKLLEKHMDITKKTWILLEKHMDITKKHGYYQKNTWDTIRKHFDATREAQGHYQKITLNITRKAQRYY